MALDGDDIGRDDTPREVRKRDAINIGLLLTFLGVVLLVGPLITSTILDAHGEDIATLVNGFPIYMFLSVLFLAFGLTVLFSQVVDYGAVGAGKVKILGFEMPMEFQGAAMILFVLLLGIGISVKQFDLMSINSEWGKWTALNKKLADMTNKVQSLEVQLVVTSGRYEEAKRRSKDLREVLVAQTSTQAQSLMIRFQCAYWEKARIVNWAGSGSGSDRTGNLLTHAGQGGGENSTDLPSQAFNPFTLKFGNVTTYTIMSADELTKKSTPVISVKFHFEKENLVATIWPNTISLLDLCKMQDKPPRDQDGQAARTEARAWQDKAELEPEF